MGGQPPHRAPMAACESWDARDGERIRSRELSRTGMTRVRGRWVSCRLAVRLGVEWLQPGQGATELGFPGPAWGRCRVRRRAERVRRPARAKNRRRRVLVVGSPRPMRAVQITCTVQAPLAAKRPEGRWFSPTPYLRSRIAFSISAWQRWSASSSRVSPSRSVMKP